MAESTWYFAVGDEERGPVTEAQIRTLIGTGNLTRDDLVWREGLSDWTPAGEVPGLFDKEPPGAAPPSRSGAEPPQKKPPSPTGPPAAEALPVARKPPHLSEPIDLIQYWTFMAQPLLLVGLLVVLLSRGCDSLAERDLRGANPAGAGREHLPGGMAAGEGGPGAAASGTAQRTAATGPR